LLNYQRVSPKNGEKKLPSSSELFFKPTAATASPHTPRGPGIAAYCRRWEKYGENMGKIW